MNPTKRRRSNRKIRDAVVTQCGNLRRLAYEDQVTHLNLITDKYCHQVIAADRDEVLVLTVRDWCLERFGDDGFSVGTNWISKGPMIQIGTGRLGRFVIVPVYIMDGDSQYGYQRVHGFFTRPDDAFEFKMRWG
jgi:hypothetical protein